MIFTWLVESIFLLVVAIYVTGILAATARQPRVAPATLAIGTGVGIVLGAVMYALFPLGGTNHPTSPWLHGFPIGLVVLLAWVMLLGGPLLAGVIAVRCYRGSGHPEQVTKVKVRQAVAAGLLATAMGALLGFPVVGLVIGMTIAGSVAGGPAVPPGSPPGGGLPCPPHPVPDPPDGIWLAGASADGLVAGTPGAGEDDPYRAAA